MVLGVTCHVTISIQKGFRLLCIVASPVLQFYVTSSIQNGSGLQCKTIKSAFQFRVSIQKIGSMISQRFRDERTNTKHISLQRKRTVFVRKITDLQCYWPLQGALQRCQVRLISHSMLVFFTFRCFRCICHQNSNEK